MDAIINDPNATPAQKEKAEKNKKGMCTRHKAFSRSYNTPEGAAAAKECQCPSDPGDSPFTPNPGCGENPPLPTPGDCTTDFPVVNGKPQVMRPCTSCPN
jgi:hypothetical protein